MEADLSGVVEIMKDKFGRKEIIALVTVAAETFLTYLCITKAIPEPYLKPVMLGMVLTFLAGAGGYGCQLYNDLKNPRNTVQK